MKLILFNSTTTMLPREETERPRWRCWTINHGRWSACPVLELPLNHAAPYQSLTMLPQNDRQTSILKLILLYGCLCWYITLLELRNFTEHEMRYNFILLDNTKDICYDTQAGLTTSRRSHYPDHVRGRTTDADSLDLQSYRKKGYIY